jgi:S-formylglutathione hydrolase FrmB
LVVRSSILFFILTLLTGCSPETPRPEQPRTQELVQQASTGSITDVRFWSKSLNATLWYRAIVPVHEPTEHLPVLYLLHGANSDPVEMMAQSNVVQLASMAHLIVILPSAGNSYYSNAQHLSGSRWEDAITDDLLHDVEDHFPIRHERRYAAIAGISMGGYGAVKLALKHPELYSFVGVMSGALDITRRPPNPWRWGQTVRIWEIFGYLPSTRTREDVFELLHRNPAPQDFQWFVSCGEHEPLKPINQRFVKQLSEYKPNLHLILIKGGHDWQNWNLALPQLFISATSALNEEQTNFHTHP